MIGIRLRRACLLLAAIAVLIAQPLPMDGAAGADATTLLDTAAAMGGPPCNDCECCTDERLAGAEACMDGCIGVAASLPRADDAAMTVSTVPVAEVPRRRAGLAVAPDPTPPKSPIPA